MEQELMGLTEDQAWMCLWLLIKLEDYHKWKEFEHEIKYKNRFFPKCDLLDNLLQRKEQLEMVVKPGTILYRARLFPTSFLEIQKEPKRELLKLLSTDNPELDQQADIESYIEYFLPFLMNDPKFIDKFKQIFQKKKRFWGYGRKDSDATPIEKTTNYRASPKNISYLYTAEDVKTAIMEVRPHRGQYVSVATVKVKKPLIVCNFFIQDNEIFDDLLSKAFSNPNFGNDLDYIPTQFICEYIKKMGYDGVRFQSSLNSKGANIVLFDTTLNDQGKHENYEITGSKVYQATDIDVTYSQVAPLK